MDDRNYRTGNATRVYDEIDYCRWCVTSMLTAMTGITANIVEEGGAPGLREVLERDLADTLDQIARGR